MMSLKFYIGPMSKNIIDSIIEFSNTYNIEVGIIPSRRQIDTLGGYVNNWNTEELCNYIRSKSENIELIRDHCGPSQGSVEDDGLESFVNDCNFFDTIHIDVWKKYPDYQSGFEKTLEFIKLGYSINKDLSYEIGTEESIRKFEPEELDRLLNDLKSNLPTEIFQKIKYLVIQSGTALKENKNIGLYESVRLTDMIKISKKWNLISKEHNGDYVSDSDLFEKNNLGLQTINIAPEFGHIETSVITSEIKKSEDLYDSFFQLCLNSGKWKKWVDSSFDPILEKEKLIQITGHYVFSTDDFLEIKSKIPTDIDNKIKSVIINKLKKLHRLL